MRKKHLKISSSIIIIAVLLFSFASVQAFELQWYGQSAFKITTPGGKIIVIDPFITKNPKTPAELKDLSQTRQGRPDPCYPRSRRPSWRYRRIIQIDWRQSRDEF